jgi:TM2 domain-containing membrane protein YozV
MNQEMYQTPKSSWIMRLFWRAAGADRFLLERSTYGDQIKYVCLGGIIIATGLMAGLAGGYAFYTIFEPKGDAIDSFKTAAGIGGASDITHLPTMIKATLFGIIWGLIIFNIDRFIITSTGKGDGTEDITKKELKSALPRLIMGAIIALTISKPIEIRMFKTEIDVKLHEKQMEQQQAYKARTDSLFNSELAKKDKEIEKFEADLQDKISRHKALEAQYIEEARIVTVGPRALAVKAQMESVAKEIEQGRANPDYLRIKKEKDEIEKRREQALATSGKVAAGLDGLLERIKLAHEIAGWVISLFITLLFMAIELTPIFFKLMLIKGPYDYLEENAKELIKVNNGIQVDYNFYPDKQGIERDRITQHEVIRLLKEKLMVLEAQAELSRKAMEAWRVKKLEDVVNHPEAYITEETIHKK